MTNKVKIQNRLFTFAACLGIVLVQLDVSVVNVGLHVLKESYKVSVADLEWVINAYALVFAALMLCSGSVVDRFGSKKTFITGVVVFIVASVCCALAPTIYWLDIMRGVQGIGAALLLPSSLTLLRHYYPDQKQRASAIAMWASSGALALVAGPIIGGVLIKFLGWQSIFLINFPLGVISIAIIYWLAGASDLSHKKINYVGQFTLASALALLTFTLTEVGNFGWSSPVILSTLTSGVMLLLLYGLLDKYSKNPVISREVLSNSLITNAVLVGFLCNLVFYGAVFIFSIFFQNKLHLSALETGIAFMPMMIFTALINFCSKWFTQWLSIRSLSLLGSLISLVGFCLIMLISSEWTVKQLFIPMILLGSGTSFAMPVMTNLILSQSTGKSAGSASAFFNCARQMGGVTGVALFGLLFSMKGNEDMTSALTVVSITAACITVVWIVMGFIKLPACRLHDLPE